MGGRLAAAGELVESSAQAAFAVGSVHPLQRTTSSAHCGWSVGAVRPGCGWIALSRRQEQSIKVLVCPVRQVLIEKVWIRSARKKLPRKKSRTLHEDDHRDCSGRGGTPRATSSYSPLLSTDDGTG